jgi:hypothetical protein
VKVKGFDNKEYPWTLKKQVKNTCSAGHKLARALLKELFPLDTIYEEVSLPGSATSKNKTLYADFYLRSRSMIVEVQGEQHSEHIPFFHKTKANFFKGQMRDRVKQDWCEMNGITLIELPVSETVDEWRDRIKG